MKELSGIPLALEQAGALIRDGEFSFSRFNATYKTEYRRLMENHPQDGFWSYDKNRVIMTILDITYSSLKNNPSHAALLHFTGVLGSWQIPMTLIEGFLFTDACSTDPTQEDMGILQDLLHDPSFLRLALRRLARLSLIKLKEEDGRITSFMIHRVMCQWCIDYVVAARKQSYIIHAAHCLAQNILITVQKDNLVSDITAHGVRRGYLAPLENCISLVRRYILQNHINSRQYVEAYIAITRHAAAAYLNVGLAEDATKYFHESIEYDTMKAGTEGIQWPASEVSLSLLAGLARAYQKTSDLEKAVETLQTALSLSERLFGSIDETTVAIASRLKEISERREVELRHHKSVVIASTDTETSWKATGRAQQSSRLQNVFQQPPSSAAMEQNELDEGLPLRGESATDVLRGAAYDGDEAMVTLLLGLPDIDPTLKDKNGRTPLFMAVWGGRTNTVKLLLDSGKSEPDSKDIYGETPLGRACWRGSYQIVQLLLDTGMVDVNVEDKKRATPLGKACWRGHTKVAELLIDSGADIYAQGAHYGSALQAASARGHKDVVILLLDKGAEVNAQSGPFGDPLRAASASGHTEVVNVLLDKGAKIDAPAGIFDHALYIASEGGHRKVVEALLDKGADVEAKGSLYGSALQAASVRGHMEIVEVLLNHGADVEAKGGAYANAIDAASSGAHYGIVELLEANALAKKASRNKHPKRWRSVFQKLRR